MDPIRASYRTHDEYTRSLHEQIVHAVHDTTHDTAHRLTQVEFLARALYRVQSDNIATLRNEIAQLERDNLSLNASLLELLNSTPPQ